MAPCISSSVALILASAAPSRTSHASVQGLPSKTSPPVWSLGWTPAAVPSLLLSPALPCPQGDQSTCPRQFGATLGCPAVSRLLRKGPLLWSGCPLSQPLDGFVACSRRASGPLKQFPLPPFVPSPDRAFAPSLQAAPGFRGFPSLPLPPLSCSLCTHCGHHRGPDQGAALRVGLPSSPGRALWRRWWRGRRC